MTPGGAGFRRRLRAQFKEHPERGPVGRVHFDGLGDRAHDPQTKSSIDLLHGRHVTAAINHVDGQRSIGVETRAQRHVADFRIAIRVFDGVGQGFADGRDHVDLVDFGYVQRR
jgi:hypothetical protein